MTFSLRFNVVRCGHLRPGSYDLETPAPRLQPGGDLRVSRIVDQPNGGVSFYMPLSVFH